jgi:hypothetical protein
MDGRREERERESRQQWVARTADWQLGHTSGTGPFQRPTGRQGRGRAAGSTMRTEREKEREKGRWVVEGRRCNRSYCYMHIYHKAIMTSFVSASKKQRRRKRRRERGAVAGKGGAQS